MASLLTQFAINSIWCDPRQDRQTVIRLARVTKNGGAYKSASVVRQQVRLPNSDISTDKGTYHVYQIGQLPPHFFNMMTIPEDTRYSQNISVQTDGHTTTPIPSVEKSFVLIKDGEWHRVSQLCAANSATIDIYIENGTKLPRHECWLMRMSDRNFILAVRIFASYDLGSKLKTDSITGVTSRILRTLDNEPLYIRFYSNALFDVEQWRTNTIDPVFPIRVLSNTINNQSEWNVFNQSCQQIVSNFGYEGHGIYQIDGYMTNRPFGFESTLIGKTLSFIWDASIRSISYLKLSELPTFVSELDAGKTKYLILRNDQQIMIDYFDDIDFYLIRKYAPGIFKGVFIGRVKDKPIRQLTHNSYSIRKSIIDNLIASDLIFSEGELELVVVTRTGGRNRAPVHQHTRIEDLNRLSYEQIVEAMTSPNNVTVPEWKAAYLENDAYAKLMGVDFVDITDTLVEDAYGYNAATRLIADPTDVVFESVHDIFAKAPISACIPDNPTVVAKRVVFCYDTDGRYIGHFNNAGNEALIAIPDALKPEAKLTEVFGLKNDVNDNSIVFNANVTDALLKQWGFRCYICPIIGGIPNEEWEDVTGGNLYQYLPNGDTSLNTTLPTVSWDWAALSEYNLFPCVRIGGYMQCVTLPQIAIDRDSYLGYLAFTVESSLNWINGIETKTQTLATGTIDVFMDGEVLHHGLDFYVKWPVVVIVKKPKTDVMNTQIIYRAYGFCDKVTMQPVAPRELGFVKGKILSVNGNYDVRNDRNIRIVVSDGVYTRDEVAFAENAVDPKYTLDGKPYSVSDYVLQVEPFSTKVTNEYRDRSVDLDNRVADYLETRLGTWHPTRPIVDVDQWQLVSPFCSAIIHAIKNGDIVVNGQYTNAQIDNIVANYKWLLEFDPCVNGVDSNYVYVNAHQFDETIELQSDAYSFVENIISIYLNGLPDLTPSLTIGV